MGNCQAIDAATLVIQHPCGKVEKLYFPVSASEVMKMNPGHYVALLISTTLYNHSSSSSSNSTTTTTTTHHHHHHHHHVVDGPVRLTRIKLLRPTDTLVLGQVYRLITTQEVMKGLLAKKHGKVKKMSQQQQQQDQDQDERIKDINGDEKRDVEVARSQLDKDNKVKKKKNEKLKHCRQRATGSRSKTWQPSLLSISEATS